MRTSTAGNRNLTIISRANWVGYYPKYLHLDAMVGFTLKRTNPKKAMSDERKESIKESQARGEKNTGERKAGRLKLQRRYCRQFRLKRRQVIGRLRE